MKIIVCLKQVPDTASRIKLKPGNREIDLEGLEFITNPYDEFALEEALRIKERFNGGEVVVISAGPERTRETLRRALALGADRGILLKTELKETADNYAVARVIYQAIKRIEYDLILCGKQAVDDDASQVGGIIAELLGIAHVSVINKLEIWADKEMARAHRQIEGGIEIVETRLPCLFTCQKGLNEPRLPSLKGIMGAKRKDLQEIEGKIKGGEKDLFSSRQNPPKLLFYSFPPERPPGKIVAGKSPEEQVKNLINLLREEAKVI